MSDLDPPTRREMNALTDAVDKLRGELRADRETYVAKAVFDLTIKQLVDKLDEHDSLLTWVTRGALGFLMAAVVGVAIYVLLTGGAK